ncbi:MAG: hypothetical protein WBD32_04235, partial [Acidobacteriaceae bacterium]
QGRKRHSARLGRHAARLGRFCSGKPGRSDNGTGQRHPRAAEKVSSGSIVGSQDRPPQWILTAAA